MRNTNKIRWIGVLILISMLNSCQVQKPNEPSRSAKLSVNLQMSDGSEQGGLISHIRPVEPLKSMTPVFPASPESIEDVQIVFYHFDMTIEELIESYDTKEVELEDVLDAWEGDMYDFEAYWIGFTKAIFDIVAPGKYNIERQDQLEIDGHHATGEFELGEGVKYILVGLTGHERLEYVGESFELYDPDTQTYSIFFELESEQEKQVNITLYGLYGGYYSY
ncbi:hypothetical protein HQ585_13840 [candidate division KSB1 bacterium]|nr:hypothetical protein [candidate division KSB1 bacterium]